MRCGFLKYDKMRALLEAYEGATSAKHFLLTQSDCLPLTLVNNHHYMIQVDVFQIILSTQKYRTQLKYVLNIVSFRT